MQNQVKNLITSLTSWSGLSGPIPNAAEMRRKREQARQASLGVNVLGRGIPSSGVTNSRAGQ